MPPMRRRRAAGRAFYWHYARQIKGLIVALFIAGTFVALLDSAIPVFIGRVVALLTAADATGLSAQDWRQIALIGAVLLVVRPLAVVLQALVTNQAVNPGFTNLVRCKAIGMWCARAGAFSRMISRGASPTG